MIIYKDLIKKPSIITVVEPNTVKYGISINQLSVHWERSPLSVGNEVFSLLFGKSPTDVKNNEFLRRGFNYYTKPGTTMFFLIDFNELYAGINDGIYIKTTGNSFLNISLTVNPYY